MGGLLLTVASLYSLYAISFGAYIITFLLKIKDVGFVRKKKKKVEFKEIFPVISKRFDIKMILLLSIIPTIISFGF